MPASFTVRVELPGAGAADYVRLHEAMTQRGFVSWIRSSDKCQLPMGEYNLHHSDLALAAVLAQAVAAANAARPTPEPRVLVTEAAGRLWSGLGPWRP